MAYYRQPNVVLAGQALTQHPEPTTTVPPGVVSVTLDNDIATTTSLGVVQVGSGLSITPGGILSVTGSPSTDYLFVKLISANYTATASDQYIGATTKNIVLTLPAGVLGRVYYIKNQSEGSIKVQGTGGQTIDGSAFKTLGSNLGFMAVFDGTRWNTL